MAIPKWNGYPKFEIEEIKRNRLWPNVINEGDFEIAGIMGLCDFPLAPLMAIKLSQHVDILILKYDAYQGKVKRGYFNGGVWGTNGKGGYMHYKILSELDPFEIPVEHCLDRKPYRPGEFLLSRLERIKPRFVFQCDSDETFPGNFGKEFYDEFEIFKRDEGLKFMRFEWEMGRIDSEKERPLPIAPICKHVKVYRWHPEISYHRGRGFGQPYFPDKPPRYMNAQARMIHYWAYTEEMELHKAGRYSKGRPHVVENMYWHGDDGAYDRWKRYFGDTIPKEKWIEKRLNESTRYMPRRKKRDAQRKGKEK